VADGGSDRPPYDTAVRLHLIARDHWDSIDGAAAAAGVDPFALSPHRFCNLVYAWALQRVEDVAKFDAELTAPLPGANRQRATRRQTAEESRAATNDLAAFASWAQTVQGGGR
jgi:hypothetical protein